MYFTLGAKIGAGGRPILDRIQGWETKAVRRFVLIQKKEDETRAEYCTRTARIARKIWTEMKQSFLFEVIPESM